MAKPKTPNQRKKYEELKKRLLRYELIIQSIYDTFANDACKIVLSLDIDEAIPFRFADYPHVAKAVEALQDDLAKNIKATILRGTSDEWGRSNVVQDLFAKKMLGYYNAQVNGKKYRHYYLKNSDQLKAFQNRVEKGMNLSQKIWNLAEASKTQLEKCIATAIQKGFSAITLSKQVSKYLNDFPSMQKDYKELYGKANDIHDCEYNSARLARSEINMAYRKSEQTRWSQMDFVLGYEIKLSHMHPRKDVCDELQGVYPKDFEWLGWHPNCFCYEIPILMSEDDFWSDNVDPAKYVTEMPSNFTEWVSANEDRIIRARERDTLPYFLSHNPSKWSVGEDEK